MKRLVFLGAAIVQVAQAYTAQSIVYPGMPGPLLPKSLLDRCIDPLLYDLQRCYEGKQLLPAITDIVFYVRTKTLVEERVAAEDSAELPVVDKSTFDIENLWRDIAFGMQNDDQQARADLIERVETFAAPMRAWRETPVVKGMFFHGQVWTDFHKTDLLAWRDPNVDEAHVRRVAGDGFAYTKKEFIDFFEGVEEWDAAAPEADEHALQKKAEWMKDNYVRANGKPFLATPLDDVYDQVGGTCYAEAASAVLEQYLLNEIKMDVPPVHHQQYASMADGRPAPRFRQRETVPHHEQDRIAANVPFGIGDLLAWKTDFSSGEELDQYIHNFMVKLAAECKFGDNDGAHFPQALTRISLAIGPLLVMYGRSVGHLVRGVNWANGYMLTSAVFSGSNLKDLSEFVEDAYKFGHGPDNRLYLAERWPGHGHAIVLNNPVKRIADDAGAYSQEEFLDYYRDRYSDEENLQYWNSLNPDQCLWDATNSWGKGLNSAGDGTVTWAYEVYAVRQNHEKPGHLTVDLKNPNSILHSRIVQYLSRSAPALELVNAEPESFFRSLEVSQLPPKMLQSFLRQQSLQSLIDKLPPQHPYLSVPGISIPQLVLLEWASKLSRESLLVFIKDIRSDRSFLHVLTVAALNQPGLREIIEASPEQLAELVDRSQNDVLKSALPRALFNAISTNQAAALPKLFDTLATIGEPWGIFEYQSGGWRDFLVHFVEEDSCTDLNIADFLVARFAAPPKSEFMPRMIGAVTRAFERFAEPGNLAQTSLRRDKVIRLLQLGFSRNARFVPEVWHGNPPLRKSASPFLATVKSALGRFFMLTSEVVNEFAQIVSSAKHSSHGMLHQKHSGHDMPLEGIAAIPLSAGVEVSSTKSIRHSRSLQPEK